MFLGFQGSFELEARYSGSKGRTQEKQRGTIISPLEKEIQEDRVQSTPNLALLFLSCINMFILVIENFVFDSRMNC